MPRMDGLETLREIKKINPTLPVIMTSGSADEEDVRNFLESGALSFLRKPIEIKTLRSYIRDILKGSSRGVIIVRRTITSISIRYKL
jgi:DNA-binding response OmpR family regulator